VKGRLHYDFPVTDRVAGFIFGCKDDELLSLGDGGQCQDVTHYVVLQE